MCRSNLFTGAKIQIKDRAKIPISTPEHQSAIGVHLILDYSYNAIQFYEITSAKKGYGEKKVKAVLMALPDDWQTFVVMDYSDGFWDRMIEKYNNLSII